MILTEIAISNHILKIHQGDFQRAVTRRQSPFFRFLRIAIDNKKFSGMHE